MPKGQFNASELLEGDYSLKIGDHPAKPEEFLDLFKGKEYYQDVRKFVRRVDNDTGIPYLYKEEYERARKVLHNQFLNIYEDSGIISSSRDKVYLRGKRYYLNFNANLAEIEKQDFPTVALSLLEDSIKRDLEFGPDIMISVENAETIEERMVIGGLLDLYRNHLMVLFTGLYESMKVDETIDVEYYNLIRREVETIIDDYYRLIIEGKEPIRFINFNKLLPIFEDINKVIHIAEEEKIKLREKGKDPNQIASIYDGRRYLTREFDHPGRMILYASHLLSQIKDRSKQYDLLVNLLNGSAEIGLTIQTIDNILETNSVRDTTIFEVDFARYSMKDREDVEVSTYIEFEDIAIPIQLRRSFRQKVEGKNTLIVDDNLNTGQSLYNVQRALEEIARFVDISTAEVTPETRVIELIEDDFKRKGITGIDPRIAIMLVEDDLTYLPIGWWRDQPKILEDRIFQEILEKN